MIRYTMYKWPYTAEESINCVGVAGGAISKPLLTQFRSKPLRWCNSFFSGEGGEGGGAHTPEDGTLPAIICY